MKTFVILFLLTFLSISTTLSQGWVQTMSGYANEIDCGSATQVAIEGTMPMGSNFYQAIYRKSGTNWQLYSNTHLSFQNSYRPGIAAGTLWASLFDGVSIFGATKNNGTLNLNAMYMSVANSQNALMTSVLSGNNNVFLIDASNNGTFLPGTTNIGFSKAVMGFDGTIYGIALNTVSTPNGTTNVYKHESNVWTPVNAIGALIATDISVGDQNKVLVVSGGNIFYLDQGNTPNEWKQDFTVPSGETVKRVSISTDGTAYMLTDIPNPDIYSDNNIYNTTWNEINPCATASAPANVSQAWQMSICAGNATNLQVTGSGTLTWFDAPTGGNLLGTGSTFNTGQLWTTTTFYVESTFTNCNTERTAIEVVVTPEPVITQQPIAVTTCEGNNVVFEVEATNGNIIYQWRYNNVNITNETDPTLVLNNVTTSNAGNYSVVITNACTSILSDAVQLSVDPSDLSFTGHPSSSIVCNGSSSTLSASYTGTVTNVQWYKDGQQLTGENNSTLNLSNINSTKAGEYYLVIEDNSGCDLTSNIATIDVSGIESFYALSNEIFDDEFNVNNGSLWTQAPTQIAPTPDRFNQLNYAIHNQSNSGGGFTTNTPIAYPQTTISFWISDQIGANSPPLIYGPDLSAPYHHLRLQNNSMYIQSPTGNYFVAPNQALSSTGWNHVVWTANGSENYVYMNGTLVIQTNDGVNPADYPIGSFFTRPSFTNGNAMRGKYDDVTVINKTLTPEEVNHLRGFEFTTQKLYDIPCVGGSATLSANLIAPQAGVTYQWYKDGSPLSGATNNTLVLNSVSPVDAGIYHLEASYNCIVVSSPNIQVDAAYIDLISINTQPQSAAICEGDSYTLAIDANNASTYQWFQNGSPISGANSATYTIPSFAGPNIGNYGVQMTNACGTTSSQAVQLSIEFPPQINSSLNSAALCEGQSVNYSTVNQGSNPSYQWFFNGSPISGANNFEYNINNITLADDGGYYLEISNSCGTATSNTAILDVAPGITFNNHPSDVTVCDGTNHTFSVDFNGTATGIQWHFNGVDIPGATGTSYTINNISTTDAGNYDVEITSACGTSVSNSAELTVEETPAIVSGLSPVVICEGSALNLSVNATGTDLDYAWTLNGGTIASALTDNYNVPNATVADAGDYQVTVINGCGSVASNTVTATIFEEVVITSQPSGVSLCLGDNYTLSTAFTGDFTSIVWLQDGMPIPGANGLTYEISNAVISDGGIYEVQILSDCGTTINSDQAAMSIVPNTAINTQPINTTACEGTNTAFEVVGEGTFLNYQWYFNNNPVTGGTNAALNLLNVDANNLGDYYVEVSGLCGPSVTSNTVNLNLEFEPEFASPILDQVYCEGEQVILTTTINNNPTTIDWLKDNTPVQSGSSIDLTYSSIELTDAGTYQINAMNNCGNIASNSFTIDVNPIYEVNLNETICFGDSYVLDGTSYTQSGSYTTTLHTINNCDSIVNLELTVLPEIETQISAAVCDGDTYSFGGQNLTASGIYTDVLTAVDGCDSTVVLDLTMIDANTVFNATETICFGESYQFGSQTLTSAGTFTETFSASAGCDSIVSLDLIINSVIDDEVTASGTTLTASQLGATYQWLDCDNGNIAISGETNQSFTATVSGNYAVEITVNGCTEVSDCNHVQTNLGVKDEAQSNVTVYPIPANNFVYIEGVIKGSYITLYDALGNKVAVYLANENSHKIDLDNLNSGVYFLHLSDFSNSKIIKKLIVSK